MAPEPSATQDTTDFVVRSSAFDDGGPIPRRYTCDGEDISPEIAWSGAPEGTRSLALVVRDRDVRDFVHWIVYDIAPNGSKVLKNRLVAPLRVADTNRLVTLRLPGVVHRFAKGHRIQVAVAASDAAYAGNTVPQRVSVMSGPDSGSTLGLPVVGKLVF